MVNVYETGPLEGQTAQSPVLTTAGAMEVRLAETGREVEAAQRLRYEVFYEEMNAQPSEEMRSLRRDFDRFDEFCDHLLVIDRDVQDTNGQPSVVGTYRFMRDDGAARAGGFYTAGEFNIAPMLKKLPAGFKVLELGRSCIIKEYRIKPVTMQLLWKGVMAYVARFSIDLMIGCASLPGTDPDALATQLSYMHHFHPMPEGMEVRAQPDLYVEMNRIPKDQIDPREALRTLPAMLKGYVRAGASIGEGAVIDRQFDTTDVLIFFPVAKINARYRSRFGIKVKE